MAYKLDNHEGIGWVGPPEDWNPSGGVLVSLRWGGVSQAPYASLNLGRSAGDEGEDVLENERRLAAALDLPGEAARARLEHGPRCLRVEGPGVYRFYDGLLTQVAGLPLWLTVADCFPVFFTAGDWVGLLHCGWRGTAAGAARVIVGELSRASGKPTSDLRAWIGPGICARCYPISREVADQFPIETWSEQLMGWAHPQERSPAVRASEASCACCLSGGTGPPGERSSRETRGVIRLNLGDAVRRQLIDAGLNEQSIDQCGLCTSCRPDLFFSYRRDGARSGRMAAVIWRG